VTWLALAALVAGARTPMQVAVLAYVGAAGLTGVTVVATLMLTPAGHVVQVAIEPARELVQTILPVSLSAIWEPDPRHEITAGSAATSVAIATQVPLVADAAPELGLDTSPASELSEPLRVDPAVFASPDAPPRRSQNVGAPATDSTLPTEAVQPALEVGAEAVRPVAVQPAAPASVAPAALRLAMDGPVAAAAIPTPAVLAVTVAPRVAVRLASTPVPQVVAVADLPTAVSVRSASVRVRADTQTTALEPAVVAIDPPRVPATVATVVAAAPPPHAASTEVPVSTANPVAPPTHQPTSEPTQRPAPTATSRPTGTSVPPSPTQKPTQTSVRTKSPTYTPVSRATPKPTVKPTVEPTHPPATATPRTGRRPPVNPPPEG